MPKPNGYKLNYVLLTAHSFHLYSMLNFTHTCNPTQGYVSLAVVRCDTVGCFIFYWRNCVMWEVDYANFKESSQRSRNSLSSFHLVGMHTKNVCPCGDRYNWSHQIPFPWIEFPKIKSFLDLKIWTVFPYLSKKWKFELSFLNIFFS